VSVHLFADGGSDGLFPAAIARRHTGWTAGWPCLIASRMAVDGTCPAASAAGPCLDVKPGLSARCIPILRKAAFCPCRTDRSHSDSWRCPPATPLLRSGQRMGLPYAPSHPPGSDSLPFLNLFASFACDASERARPSPGPTRPCARPGPGGARWPAWLFAVSGQVPWRRQPAFSQGTPWPVGSAGDRSRVTNGPILLTDYGRALKRSEVLLDVARQGPQHGPFSKTER